MNNTLVKVPFPVNEPVRSYGKGSPEKASLKAKIEELSSQQFDIPIIIGGKEIQTNDTIECVMPHNHKHVLAKFHQAGEKEIKMAIDSAMDAQKLWSSMPLQARVAIFKRISNLLQGPYRDLINASTMLNQSKNVFQAEIDAACEFIDFINFNVKYAEDIYSEQPLYSPDGMWNMVQYRPLEGFVFAVTPFNFTSIAGNLPTAPAIMGNVALWKPASSSVYSGYFLMKMFQEAGLPAGVINFIPGLGRTIGNLVMKNENLAGIHFTGSTAVFQSMWKTIGENIENYKSYPRIVGETGGKDFILAHLSADEKILVSGMIRGAFEYQGQKCSAASRCYVPKDMWERIKDDYIAEVKTIKVGDVTDQTNFMNAVIDKASFDNIASYIEYAKESPLAEIITGGGYDDSVGYFIEPTTIVTTDPNFKLMCEEIFGPVLTIHPYDQSWEEICEIVDSTSPYALTGAIFSRCREAIQTAHELLVNAAGNFYVNDKPTGAVVGQQPFGGSRASGTNDKAGSPLNLLRWVSQRTVKETFNAPSDYRYPFLEEK